MFDTSFNWLDTKEGKEVKRCERRKDLLECGVIPWGSKECPYQG